FFTTPTAIVVSFGAPSEDRTALLRVEPAGVNLERLTRLDELIDRVQEGRLTLAAARAALVTIERAPERYPAWATVLAGGAAAGPVRRSLGGGPAGGRAGPARGRPAGWLARARARHAALSRVFEWLASMLAAGLAVAWCALVRPTAPQVAALSGLIVLVP